MPGCQKVAGLFETNEQHVLADDDGDDGHDVYDEIVVCFENLFHLKILPDLVANLMCFGPNFAHFGLVVKLSHSCYIDLDY